jgi:cytochrome P450
MASSITLSVIVALVACLAYVVYQKALPKPIPGIPCDEAASKHVLGSLPSIMAHIRQHGVVLPWIFGQNEKYRAPLIQWFPAPFTKPTLVLCDFQEAQDVLLRRTKDFDRATVSGDAFRGIMTDFHLPMRSNDPKLKGNKELIRDLMSPTFLHEVSAPQIYSKTLDLIDLWSEKTRLAPGRPFEARQDIFDAALDIINAVTFTVSDDMSMTKQKTDHILSHYQVMTSSASEDEPVHFSKPPVPEDIIVFKNVIDLIGSQTVSPLPRVTYWLRYLTDASIRRDVVGKDDLIRARIKDSVDRLEAGDTTQHSATDYMIQREASVARKENRTPDLYSKRIIDELFGYLIAGHETTSSALAWTLKLMSDHEAVQERLRQTLESVFAAAVSDSRHPTALEIVKTDIPYLDAVIEECVRVGSPTPLLAREAVLDTVLLGHQIPKGVTVLVNSAGPGFHTKPLQDKGFTRSETSKERGYTTTWNPDELHIFNPDRWLKTNSDGIITYDSQAGPFLSFSLGPRGCYGKKLAYMELRLVLTLLIWNFKIQKVSGSLGGYDAKEAVTSMPKTCYLKLLRRRR